jgi:hypothetical protein
LSDINICLPFNLDVLSVILNNILKLILELLDHGIELLLVWHASSGLLLVIVLLLICLGLV